MTFRAGLGVAIATTLLAFEGVIPARGDEALAHPAGAAPAAHAAEPARIVVKVARNANGYVVEGRCVTQVPRSEAWEVLTDYDAIDGFVSSMRESRIMERADGHLLVEQTAGARLFLFSRRMTVVLFVSEEPESAIAFEDVLLRDFESYRGAWRLEEHGDHREIHYQVTARPSFSVPDLIARGMFGRTVRDLLTEVEAEMARRSGLANLAPPGSTEPHPPGKDPS